MSRIALWNWRNRLQMTGHSYDKLSSNPEPDGETQRKGVADQDRRILASAVYLVLGFLLAATFGIFAGLFSAWHRQVDLRCSHPAIRREWRALTSEEKGDFVRAFNCLATVPSRWRPNGTLYDDYAYLHGTIGSWAHRSSSFFPWHRYALHAWKNDMKEHCEYMGEIPYWDWTIDHRNLANSSIWDSESGFGGDGDPNGPETVGRGRCVVDGPFVRLRPILYNHTYGAHCLSRGFNHNGTLGLLPAQPFSPEEVGKMLRNDSFVYFTAKVEQYLHNELHQAVAGDFLALTAANDPVFFLHHAQLDHLWWRWQHENRTERLHTYFGKHMFNSTGPATVDDMLLYGGLVPDIPVSEVMDTESEMLCYTYS